MSVQEVELGKASRAKLADRQATDLTPVNVRLDWWAYWQAFKDMHGEPVDLGWCLAFPDGWTYSRSDPRGPESPPPADPAEHLVLRVRYWRARLSQVEAEARRLRVLIDALRNLQRGKSASLQHRFFVPDEAGGGHTERGPVNAESLEAGRLAWLQNDAEECRLRLCCLLEEDVSNAQP